MNESYFETIKTRLIMAASYVNDHATRKDANRNRVNYGEAITWACVLRDMGHNTDIPVWEDDNGCLRIPYIQIGAFRMEYADGK